MLQSVKKTGRAIIAHEAPMTNGFGAEIAATVQVRPAPRSVLFVATMKIPIAQTRRDTCRYSRVSISVYPNVACANWCLSRKSPTPEIE